MEALDVLLDVVLCLVVGFSAAIALGGLFFGVYRISLSIVRRVQRRKFARRQWIVEREEAPRG